MINFLIYVVANISGFYLSFLNDKFFYFHVKFLAFVFKKLDKRRKKDCINNLNFAFGDKLSKEEKNKILDKCYKNFAFVILNALRLLFYKREKYLNKFEAHNIEILESALKNRNIVFLTAHYGDWEATSRFVAANYKNINLSVAGRLTQFSALNNLMEKSRQTYGSHFLDKRGVSKHFIKLLKQENTALGVVVDQHISPSEGIYVKFFGKDVTHTNIASILARKYKLPMIFTFTRLNPTYDKYEIFFHEIKYEVSDDMKEDILKMTQLQADFTQKIIEESPGEWFWFHKRFKAKYQEIYTYD